MGGAQCSPAVSPATTQRPSRRDSLPDRRIKETAGNRPSGAKLGHMAKSSPEKKAHVEVRALPMALQLGYRLADERSEWQVIGRPYATGGGKTIHVRVESLKQPGVTEIRSWGAHERVSIHRATADEGKRRD